MEKRKLRVDEGKGDASRTVGGLCDVDVRDYNLGHVMGPKRAVISFYLV